MSLAIGQPPTPPAQPAHPVLEALRGELPAGSTSLPYRLAMMALLVPMLLLPLLYMGLIAGAGWGVYYHAIEHTSWMTSFNLRVLGVLMYVAPLLGGSLVVLFMVKPLFAPRPPKMVDPYSLEQQQEPLLFAFVERLAEMLGAPAPKRIKVHCLPNASASFRRGVWSMFTNDMTLSIGTPLLAALNTRQLAGVLAHELGHFSQGAGMRSTYIVQRLNLWFARLVYERDAWDGKLAYQARESALLITMVLAWFCCLCIWLTRRILWLFMIASHAMSCAMLRRMEFDADDCLNRVVGSDAFASTLERLDLIAYTFNSRAEQMYDARALGRLADNLPEYIAGTAEALPREAVAELQNAIDAEKASLFATHPTTRARLNRAQAAGMEGVFKLEQPASTLLRNYEMICRWTTLGFYHAHFDEAISPEELVPTSKLLQRTRIAMAAMKAAERFYQAALSPLHTVALDDAADAPPGNADANALTESLRHARRAVIAAAPKARASLQQLEEADAKLMVAHGARALLKARVRIDAAGFGLARPSLDAAADAIDRTAHAVAEAGRAVAAFDAAVAQRLAAAFALLERPGALKNCSGAPRLGRHAAELRDALRVINDVHDAVFELRTSCAALGILLENAAGRDEDDVFTGRVIDAGRATYRILQRLHIMLDSAPYPLEHGKRSLSIAEATIGTLPPCDQPVHVAQAAFAAIDGLLQLRMEIMQRLALIAEKVERAIGLEPAAANSIPCDPV